MAFDYHKSIINKFFFVVHFTIDISHTTLDRGISLQIKKMINNIIDLNSLDIGTKLSIHTEPTLNKLQS